jgi:hypothetical protein
MGVASCGTVQTRSPSLATTHQSFSRTGLHDDSSTISRCAYRYYTLHVVDGGDIINFQPENEQGVSGRSALSSLPLTRMLLTCACNNVCSAELFPLPLFLLLCRPAVYIECWRRPGMELGGRVSRFGLIHFIRLAGDKISETHSRFLTKIANFGPLYYNNDRK